VAVYPRGLADHQRAAMANWAGVVCGGVAQARCASDVLGFGGGVEGASRGVSMWSAVMILPVVEPLLRTGCAERQEVMIGRPGRVCTQAF